MAKRCLYFMNYRCITFVLMYMLIAQSGSKSYSLAKRCIYDYVTHLVLQHIPKWEVTLSKYDQLCLGEIKLLTNYFVRNLSNLFCLHSKKGPL